MDNIDWRKRTVSNILNVERYNVDDVFVHYINDEFYVNRKYQRKLVWGLNEKQLLIDSMIKGIPLPSILLAEFEVEKNEDVENLKVLEIVDGMQRLNAIISFILGEFGIEYEGEYRYFDPYAYNETFQLLRNENTRIKVIENKKLLPKELCQDFIRYKFPVIVTGKDDETVEMIFSRINSTGRKISSHDLRQSMATGDFADVVRRIASRVRGDYTYTDRICLSDIPKISIGLKKYGYGVDIESIFWRRHDLINQVNIKESRDEEIIETLLATVLLGSFKKNKKNLDNLYDLNTDTGKDVENKVVKIGKDVLEDKFSKIFDVIDMIFESVNSDFSSFLFDRKQISNKDEFFKILFLSLYNLFSEGYIITDYESVAHSIKNARSIFESCVDKQGKVDYDKMVISIDNLYKLLKPSLSKEIVTKCSETVIEIEKRLSYSKIERQMTEFKIGISDFDSPNVNIDCVHEISQTLVAMANVSYAREEGLLIVGIADTQKSYNQWHNVYKEPAVVINQHYIPGITKEAKKLFKNSDEYYRRIRSILDKEPISTKLKNYILETFDVCDFHGVELLIFRSKNVGETSLYDGEKYVRHSSETLKI